MKLCDYKDILGIPGKGIHTHGVVGFAYLDLLGTIFISIILSLIVVIPFTIKWIQLSLGEKVETTYKNSFFWI